MTVFGLDIGTTTCCLVALDGKTGAELAVKTIPNASFLATDGAQARWQDPNLIWGKVQILLSEMEDMVGRPDCIGLAGQMHGIVYVNALGEAISPLYTWQDTRAASLDSGCGISHLAWLRRQSGYEGLSAGDGMSIHSVNLKLGLVPANTVALCTIQDYIGMRLAKLQKPITHSSDAASFGLFNLKERTYDLIAMRRCGIYPGLLPQIMDGYQLIGTTPQDIPIALAVGDNQASFAGSLQETLGSLVINVGTGGQVSFVCDRLCDDLLIQTRPYLDGQLLWAGLTLGSGRAYATLEQLFRNVVRMATGVEPASLYSLMTQEGLSYSDSEPLQICAQLTGTRLQPQKRGSIEGIGEDNLTPGALIWGFLRGIVQEFEQMYDIMRSHTNFIPKRLIGAGNGIRKNPLLCHIVSQTFGMPLLIPVHEEEAAYGAALYALCACGKYHNIEEAQRVCVHYREVES